jgi:hypothetical protein
MPAGELAGRTTSPSPRHTAGQARPPRRQGVGRSRLHPAPHPGQVAGGTLWAEASKALARLRNLRLQQADTTARCGP